MKDRLTHLDDDARNAVLIRLPYNQTIGSLALEPGYEDEGMSYEFVTRFIRDLDPGIALDRDSLRLIIVAAAALLANDPDLPVWGALETAIVWDRG